MASGARQLLAAVMILLVLQGAAFFALHALTRGDDLLHPLLHAATGALGLLVLRLGGPLLLALYGLAFGAAYAVILGLGGLAGHLGATALQLGTGDHVFHTAFGAFLVLISGVALWGRMPVRTP